MGLIEILFLFNLFHVYIFLYFMILFQFHFLIGKASREYERELLDAVGAPRHTGISQYR